MAITVDATSSGYDNFGPDYTASHTCSADATVLYVGFIVDATNPSLPTNFSITYDSVSLTEVITEGGTNYGLWVYRLINPNSGANDLFFDWDGNDAAKYVAISFEGVDTTTPDDSGSAQKDTSSSGNAPEVTVTSATGRVVVDFLAFNGPPPTLTADGTQTEQLGNINLSSASGSISTDAGAASVTMGWTSSQNNRYSYAAFQLYPESAGISIPVVMHHRRQME